MKGHRKSSSICSGLSLCEQVQAPKSLIREDAQPVTYLYYTVNYLKRKRVGVRLLNERLLIKNVGQGSTTSSDSRCPANLTICPSARSQDCRRNIANHAV